MIPILYGEKTTDFTNNGIGRLSDAISCLATEERNGLFELEMQYPVEGERFADLTMSAIIRAVPAPGRAAQLFRIYKVSKPMNGKVTIKAEHISYQLSHVPVAPFTANNAAAALAGLKENAAEACPFDFWTDIKTAADFIVADPVSLRSRLGGNKGSILDTYGGEYEFDNYQIRLWAARGANNGVTLRYGKNITDLKQEENISNTITGVFPYWRGDDVLVMLPEKVISAANAANFPYPRTKPLDLSMEFSEKPTEEQLRVAAEQYVAQNALGVPEVSISLSFVALWQTEEYKDIAPLEEVGLCDTVTVEYSKLGVFASAKVVKAVYNVLLDRYEKLEIGNIRPSLEKSLAEQKRELNEKATSSMISAAVKNGTDIISGVNGGYVVLHQDGNGIPFEMLIMDGPSIETAVNIWRFNQTGWGHSSTGYAGPYEMVAALDNGMKADWIKLGTLQGVRIIAEDGIIGGWDIAEAAIFKDVTDPDDDTVVYRVYFQPPLESETGKTKVLSCQKSVDGGENFEDSLVLYADGSGKIHDLSFDKIDGNDVFTGDVEVADPSGTTIKLSFMNGVLYNASPGEV